MKPSILVFDNCIKTTEQITEAFKDEFIVFSADSYHEASHFLKSLNSLKKEEIAVVIVDYKMDINLRILSDFKSIYKDMVVIYLIDTADSDIQIKILKSGANDLILKPLRPLILNARVKNHYQLVVYEKHLESIATDKIKDIKKSADQLRHVEKIILELLTKVINYRDTYTSEISGKTVKYINIITKKIRENPTDGYYLTREDEENIMALSQIRDIGKLAVPDTILNKKGFLTEYEFDIIQKHCVLGAQILDNASESTDDSEFLKTARNIILYHHEKWDGNGYPEKLKGSEISLCARIVSIVDVFGALINSKPFRDAFSYEYAFSIMKEGRGRNFDPYLLDLFLEEREHIENL